MPRNILKTAVCFRVFLQDSRVLASQNSLQERFVVGVHSIVVNSTFGRRRPLREGMVVPKQSDATCSEDRSAFRPGSYKAS